jgi:hypothetical protein
LIVQLRRGSRSSPARNRVSQYLARLLPFAAPCTGSPTAWSQATRRPTILSMAKINNRIKFSSAPIERCTGHPTTAPPVNAPMRVSSFAMAIPCEMSIECRQLSRQAPVKGLFSS